MTNRPESIIQAFLNACDRPPDKAFIFFEDQVYVSAQLRAQAPRWGGRLLACGLKRGARVALFLANSPAFVSAYLGIPLAGGVVVLVNTQYRQIELRHILNDSGARVCITDGERLTELAKVTREAPTLEAIVLTGSKAEGGKARVSIPILHPSSFILHPSSSIPHPSSVSLPPSGAVALIGYTSGTTGRSKGAMLTHANLAANSWAVTTAWHWTEADRLLLTLPLFHVHGLGVGLNGTFFTGGTVDLRRRFDAAEVYDALLQGEVTMFFGVPTMYTRLIAEAHKRSAQPKPIRLYVSGSAPLSVQTFQEFEQLFGVRILERYGMTETVMNLTNPYDGERRPGTVGQPFPGQEARIVDVKTRQTIDDERPGEIQVRGPNVFKGYWQNPAATAEAFDSDGWFNTGDLGWRSADGYFTISGRARELIITGGYNVYPREVEEVLLTHPGVAEAAVIGLPDPDFGEQVAAAIVRAASHPGLAAEEVVDLCREQLAGYKKPRRVFFVEALPRNALGKVQKHILREQLLEASAGDLARSSAPTDADRSQSSLG